MPIDHVRRRQVSTSFHTAPLPYCPPTMYETAIVGCGKPTSYGPPELEGSRGVANASTSAFATLLNNPRSQGQVLTGSPGLPGPAPGPHQLPRSASSPASGAGTCTELALNMVSHVLNTHFSVENSRSEAVRDRLDSK